MNILHIGPVSFRKSSGLAVVIPKMIEEQNKIDGVKAGLLNYSSAIEISKEEVDHSYGFDYFEYKDKNYKKISGFPFPYNNPDIVVIHSVYQLKIMPLINDIIKKKIPYVLFPHGGMRKEAQKYKKIKKEFANRVFFNRIVKEASKIQYLSKGEADDFYWSKDFYIVGNGVTAQKYTQKKLSDLKFNIVYIGRLDIKTKGLDLLLETVNNMKEILRKNNSQLKIYGPTENNSAEVLQKKVDEYQLNQLVKLMGPVYEQEKKEALLSANLFIQLSRNEGLPTGVLEALSYGVPCILTPGTNLSREVEANQCGWRVERNVSDISKKLQHIIEDFDDFEAYSENAIRFIDDRYSWEHVTQQTLQEYGKIIKK